MCPFRHFLALLPLVLLPIGCAPPPLDSGSLENVAQIVCPVKRFNYFLGSGKLVVRLKGQEHAGIMDVSLKDGTFRADVYSPLGGIVASVNADTATGTCVIDNRTYPFKYWEAMDSLPFFPGNHGTFGEFISCLQGELPGCSILSRAPDSIAGDGSAQWRGDSLTVRLKMGGARRRLKEVDFVYNDGWTVKFQDFRNKFPYKISISEDTGNYFSVAYERVILR